jgi:hypothetical protein
MSAQRSIAGTDLAGSPSGPGHSLAQGMDRPGMILETR